MNHGFIRSGVTKKYKHSIINKRNKLSSTQLVSVIFSISQHDSISTSHIQASSTKYLKKFVYKCIKFSNEIQFYSLIKYMFFCQINCIQEQLKG
jgi:hypothetical protein